MPMQLMLYIGKQKILDENFKILKDLQTFSTFCAHAVVLKFLTVT